jgi:hypothetical protein
VLTGTGTLNRGQQSTGPTTSSDSGRILIVAWSPVTTRQAEFLLEGASAEKAAAKVEERVEKMATQLVLGRVPTGTKRRRVRATPEVKVLYFRSLFDVDVDDDKATLPALPFFPTKPSIALFHSPRTRR